MILAAADIGGTKLSVSVADPAGIRAKVVQPTRRRGARTAVPAQLIELVEKACSLAGLRGGDVSALGVCAASPFVTRFGRRELATLTLCGGLEEAQGSLPNDWVSIPLEAELRAVFPQVRIENDCTGGVIAERLFGAGKGEDNLVYVTWSTGVGAGAYADGELLRGKNGNAMHLGYLLLPREGAASATGGACLHPGEAPKELTFERLESLVGGPGLERRYGAPAPDIFAACRAGEPRARAVVNWATGLLTGGLVNLTSLLDTRVIVVGGSIAVRNWDLVAPLIETRLRSHYPVLTREVELRRSALGEQLGDMGGLSLVMPEPWVGAYAAAEPWRRAPAPVVLDP